MRPVFAIRAVFVAAAAIVPALAQAQQIGAAAVVQNDVRRVDGGNSAAIGGGDAVVRNETIATAAASSAKLVFTDETNLAIGASARVTLDKFVYAGDQGSYSAAAVNVATGAFRFTTGNSAKKAYTISTPVATIGVRGTILDILSAPARTTVVLQEGEATVCTRLEKKRRCVDLLHAGDSVIVTVSGGSSQTRFSSKPGWTFAATCLANPALCDRTTFAQAAPAAADDMAALCGR